MDPSARRFLWNSLLAVVRQGRSVVLTSHRWGLRESGLWVTLPQPPQLPTFTTPIPHPGSGEQADPSEAVTQSSGLHGMGGPDPGAAARLMCEDAGQTRELSGWPQLHVFRVEAWPRPEGRWSGPARSSQPLALTAWRSVRHSVRAWPSW